MTKFSLAFAVLALAACGSKSKGAETTDPCKDMPMHDGPLEAGQWEGMSKEQRGEFMAHVVLPTMKEKFQAYDPEGFAEFDCATCHGANAGPEGSFEMPNPDLPVLDMTIFTNPPEEDKLILQFMSETVKPTMAELLGMPERTQTQEGFGCTECHTMTEGQ